MVRDGYKQTEVGVIPVDWEVKTFQEVMDGFSSGATPYRRIEEFYNGDINWITSGELNYNVITDTTEKITEEAVRRTNLSKLQPGTFLIAITGLEAAGTRGSCGIVGVESTSNQSCMALIPKEGILELGYLFQYYVCFGNKLALEYCQGTKQQSYTGKLVKRLPIIIPPTLTEQRAIATALADTDALLSALDALIGKKEAFKRGMMEGLLGGEIRLAGFEGEWEETTLNDLIIGNPDYGINAAAVAFKANLPVYLRITDIQENGELDVASLKSVAHPDAMNYVLNDKEIVLARTGASVGKSYFHRKNIYGEVVFAGFLIRVVPNEQVDPFFLYSQLNTDRYWNWIEVNSMRSGQPGVNSKEYGTYTISLPPSLSSAPSPGFCPIWMRSWRVCVLGGRSWAWLRGG